MRRLGNGREDDGRGCHAGCRAAKRDDHAVRRDVGASRSADGAGRPVLSGMCGEVGLKDEVEA